ncbi:hypothetical protein [Leuconostoc sp. UCMA20149]|uniref:hypothetical protein n=1 Tax=Leuconostoc sp. UCMA20149 TaxID=2583528 RepID=UPI0025B208CE|nr:hypothetical protein [Leuconostoc sp. UCMA20149]
MVTQVFDEISAAITESIIKQAKESNEKIFSQELVKASNGSRPMATLKRKPKLG